MWRKNLKKIKNGCAYSLCALYFPKSYTTGLTNESGFSDPFFKLSIMLRRSKLDISTSISIQ